MPNLWVRGRGGGQDCREKVVREGEAGRSQADTQAQVS